MRFFTPLLKRADELPPQTKLEEKFGGLPWGLPPDRWPACRACGQPQTLIAQLRHEQGRLDLGRDGRVLFVFQCNHDPGRCETWSAASGANACLVLDADELTTGPTPAPSESTALETEVHVVGWREGDDSEAEPQMVTKVSGSPSWIQGEDEGPDPPWRWVAQFDWQHHLEDGEVCTAANYGDAGIAYIYVNTADARPEGSMFWQCG